MRVRMGFVFLVRRLIIRAESEWKLAALRCTRSSEAESVEGDALGKSGASAEDVLSLGSSRARLRRRNPGPARPRR